MNPSFDYSQVEVILVDPQPNTLRLIRDVLQRLRISRIQSFTSNAGLQEALAAGTADLIIIDADRTESETFHYIKSLRTDPGSRNPFACVVVTTWSPTGGVVSRAINAGADGLLVKPASPRQVYDRLQACVDARKKFVVTSDYIGPDRRKSARGGPDIPLFDAPNTLRMKALGQYQAAQASELLTSSLARLHEQRARRASFQIPFLVEFALPGLRATPIDVVALDHLERVTAVVLDFERRFPAGELDAKLAAVCKGILALVERIRKCRGTAAAEPDVAQLERLCYGPLRALLPNSAPDDLRKEIATAVSGYRKKLEEAAKAEAEAAAAAAAAREAVEKAITGTNPDK